MKTSTWNVEGMMCEHCENRVNTALKEVNGVQDVKADAKKNCVTVTFDEAAVNERTLKDTIEEVGYDVVE